MEHSKQDVEAAAAEFLARRAHSRKELTDKLAKRRFPDGLISEVLDEYTERGWLNDVSFAQTQAAILARKCWGPMQIQAKLIRHGISRSDAQSAVDALETDWTESARSRVASRYKKGDEEKAFRHLVQRGFSKNTAREVAFSLPEPD